MGSRSGVGRVSLLGLDRKVTLVVSLYPFLLTTTTTKKKKKKNVNKIQQMANEGLVFEPH